MEKEKKKGSKKILIITIIVILLVIVVISAILFRKFKKPNKDEIIVKDSYIDEIDINYLYKETVICEDGSIYGFLKTERSGDEKYNYKGKVNKKDLEKIKEYSKKLDFSEEKYLKITEPISPVMPSERCEREILVHNDELNKNILLMSSEGKTTEKNMSENAIELTELILKYTNKQ